MKSTLSPIEETAAPNVNENARTAPPAWAQSHNGLTWRDMPSQSETGVTCRKLLFALYRHGATTPEENFFIEEKRRELGLN